MQNVESGVSLEDISSYGNFPNNRHVFSVLRAVRVSVLLYPKKKEDQTEKRSAIYTVSEDARSVSDVST